MRQLAKTYDPGLTVHCLLELVQHTAAPLSHRYGNEVPCTRCPGAYKHTRTHQKALDKKKRNAG